MEKAIELDPDYARAYGLLSWVHAHNSSQRYSWGQDPERSLDLALESARKAVALAPDDYFSHWALGFVLSLHGDFDRASAGYERALALNSSDTTLLANMSEVLYKTGRAEQAIAQIKLAIRINPRHPEWYLWDLGIAQYFAEQYQEALDTLNRMSNPSNGVRRIRAAVLVRLGRLEEAREVMSKFIETDLDSTLEEMEDSAWKDREYLDRWIDDLRTAGLPERRPLPLPDKPSIAVLPFTNMSDDPKQEYFVDGMTEDLITDLSRVSGLFVIARNSTFVYKGRPVTVRQVAEDLGVRYVLEGSVRRAGDQVRINAQLIDATTGGHLWANRYDGSVADIFALQDKVTEMIVEALALNLTDSEQVEIARDETQNVDAREAFQIGWEHYLRKTVDDVVKAVPYLEKAVQLDPNYGRAYAALALLYMDACTWGYTERLGMSCGEARRRSVKFLRKAEEFPTSLANVAASRSHLKQGMHEDGLAAAARALALGPNNPEAHLAMAWALITTGRPEDGITSIETAMRLNPRYPSHYSQALGVAHFAAGRMKEAARVLANALEHNPLSVTLAPPLAAAYARLGRRKEARAALDTWLSRWEASATASITGQSMLSNSLPFKWAADHRWVKEQLVDGVMLTLLAQDLTIEVLVETLKNGNVGERRDAVKKIGLFGPLAKDAVAVLIEALKDENRFVRKDAGWTLGKIGPMAKSAVPALKNALEDPVVRSRAEEALKRITGD